MLEKVNFVELIKKEYSFTEEHGFLIEKEPTEFRLSYIIKSTAYNFGIEIISNREMIETSLIFDNVPNKKHNIGSVIDYIRFRRGWKKKEKYGICNVKRLSKENDIRISQLIKLDARLFKKYFNCIVDLSRNPSLEEELEWVEKYHESVTRKYLDDHNWLIE